MDTAEYMDDQRSRCGILGCLVLSEQPVCQQYAGTSAGVRLDHVEDRFACLRGLFDAERCKDAVVDRVVQEQYLGRLNKDGYQRQQAMVDQYLCPG